MIKYKNNLKINTEYRGNLLTKNTARKVLKVKKDFNGVLRMAVGKRKIILKI